MDFGWCKQLNTLFLFGVHLLYFLHAEKSWNKSLVQKWGVCQWIKLCFFGVLRSYWRRVQKTSRTRLYIDILFGRLVHWIRQFHVPFGFIHRTDFLTLVAATAKGHRLQFKAIRDVFPLFIFSHVFFSYSFLHTTSFIFSILQSLFYFFLLLLPCMLTTDEMQSLT